MTSNSSEPVNRSRRSLFIFYVVGFSLIVSVLFTGLAALGVLILQITLLTTLVESLIGLAGIATIAYIGGSSIDYNGGIGNMFSRGKVDPYANTSPPSRENSRQLELFDNNRQSMG